MGEPALEVHPLTRDRWDDLATLFDRPGDPKGCWCMFYRVRGRAAVEFAAANGAEAVEGYPKDTDGARKHANEMFSGSMTMFVEAGFEEVGRRSPLRPIMRRAVAQRPRRPRRARR